VRAVKYMLMIQGNQAGYNAMSGKSSPGNPAWNKEQLEAMYAHMGAVSNDLAESGELIDGQGLGEPDRTRIVLPGKDGRPVITDGPYSETKEVLAGYWLLDCESLDRVTEIAVRVTECPVPEGTDALPILIRPVQEAPSADA
jgi:hypothetical protein